MASTRAASLGLVRGAVLLGLALGASAEGQCGPGANVGAEVCAPESKLPRHVAAGVAAEVAEQGKSEPLSMLQRAQLSKRADPDGSATSKKENLTERAYETIRDLADFVTGAFNGQLELSMKYDRCQINSTSDCSIGNFKKNAWTVVDPAGEGSPYNVDQNMKCIDSSGYVFKFWRGSSTKLYVYLEGGGACWNQWSTQGLTIPLVVSTGPLCTQSAESQLGYETGPLNMSNASNPFREHSVLFLPYCSGDGFAGDTIQNYSVNPFKLKSPKAIQKGYHHVLAAVTWLQSNSDFSSTSTLSDFTMQGCSAGTIGTQLWANPLLSRFSYKHSRVVLDSYAGIFPVEKQGSILTQWGTCDLPILTPEQQAECRNPSGLFITDLTGTAMGSHTSTRFVTINSKIDSVQRMFYTATKFDTSADIIEAVVREGLSAIAPMKDTTYYQTLNDEILQVYGAYANWQGFIVDGIPHCYNNDQWYVASGFIGGSFYSGPFGYVPETGTGTPEIPVDLEDVYAANPPSFVCEGEDLVPSKAGDSVTYCDARLA